MDSIEAASLFMSQGSDNEERSVTNITRGKATSDSENGYVMVDMGGMTISDANRQSVRLPTEVHVLNGDAVDISLTGVPGKARVPTVIGVIGGGDRMLKDYQAKIAAAKAAAIQAATEADRVVAANAEAAQQTADEVAAALEAKDQYFYHDDSGAHVAQLDSNNNETGNIIINALGAVIRKMSKALAQFTASAIAFYDGDGTGTGNILAQFTKTSAQIGKSSAKNIVLNADGIVMSNGNKYLTQHTNTSVSFYDGLGNDSSHTTAQFGGSSARIGKLSDNYLYIDNSSISICSGQSVVAAFDRNQIVLSNDQNSLTIKSGTNGDAQITCSGRDLSVRANDARIFLGEQSCGFAWDTDLFACTFGFGYWYGNPTVYIQANPKNGGNTILGTTTLQKFANFLDSL